MKKWATIFYAINSVSGELEKFGGKHVKAPTYELAVAWCRKYAIHLHVIGELVAEIPTKKDGITPDWSKKTEYEKTMQN